VNRLQVSLSSAIVMGLVCGMGQVHAQTAAPAQGAPAQTPAQPPQTTPATPQTRPAAPPATAAQKPDAAALPKQEVPLPSGYVIGPDDVLGIAYWRNPDMSAEVTVRPDGLISLPLLNEVHAGGLTPEQLREQIAKAATKFLEEEPTVSVVVKAINSRKVYITGMVAKPAYYPLSGAMTVVQLIATAGGLQEFADSKNIRIVRNENGRQVSFAFNYKDFTKGKNLKQNIELKPGDTVVVP
jgi:polysaccharide export outer membrane protein